MLTVAIASGDMASSAQLLASLEQTGLVRSVKQWSVPAEKLPESVDSLPDVVFLDLALVVTSVTSRGLGQIVRADRNCSRWLFTEVPGRLFEERDDFFHGESAGFR